MFILLKRSVYYKIRPTTLVCLITVLMFIFPMLNMVATGIDNPITTLGNGSLDEIITFTPGGGYNKDMNITLPETAIITAAELELDGLGLQGPNQQYTHTYSDTVNNQAWWGRTNLHPPTGAPSTFTTTAFTTKEYPNVKTADNLYTTHSAKGANNYPYQLFRFKIIETGITSLNVYWEGYGQFNGLTVWPYYSYGYIYNNANSTWELIGSNNSNIMPKPDFAIRKNLIGSPSNYIDTNKMLHVMVQGPVVLDNLTTADINTDFVRIITMGTGTLFPTNPTLDVGDDGDLEWDYPGIFDQGTMIDDNNDLKTELQSLVDNAAPGCRFVDITLNFTSATAGRIKISNISIDYEIPEINLPPVLHKVIPNGTLGFFEDTAGGDNLIDLKEHFWDDRDNGTLKFEILKNNGKIIASLDSDGHHLDFTSEQDHFGTAEFMVRAVDNGLDGIVGGDLDGFSDSNVFTVTVWPTNDAPVITSIDGEVIEDGTSKFQFIRSSGAQEDEWFNKTIIAEDIDGDDLTFHCNITLQQPASIEIIPDEFNDKKANLTVFATNDYVGMLYFTITVNDNNVSTSTRADDPNSEGLTGFIEVTIEVHNSNDAPQMDSFIEKSINEDEWLNFTIIATDNDLIHGDRLRFSTNITSAMDNLVEGYNYEFDEFTGEISILPNNDMVGIYWVNFGVTDFTGTADAINVKIIVNNVNDLPLSVISSPISKQAFDSGSLVYFDCANSTDDDVIHGDKLRYTWTSDVEGELSTESKFYGNFTEIGWHNITLTLTDDSNEEVQETISIKIKPVPDTNGDGKEPTDIDEADRKSKQNSYDLLLVILIIVVIIIIILVVLNLVQKRKKRERESQAGVASTPVDPTIAPQPVMPMAIQPGMGMPYGFQPIMQPTTPMLIQQLPQPITTPYPAIPPTQQPYPVLPQAVIQQPQQVKQVPSQQPTNQQTSY